RPKEALRIQLCRAGSMAQPSGERCTHTMVPLNSTTVFFRRIRRLSGLRRGLLDRRLRVGEGFMRIKVRLFWLSPYSQTMSATAVGASVARRRATVGPFAIGDTFMSRTAW